MISNDTFDLKRLYNLMMISLKSHAKTISIAAAMILLFVLLFPLSDPHSYGLFFFILYVGGFGVTSTIFNDLHNPQQAHLFLMLPCSNLERFLNKWLLSSIGYAIGTLILCYLFSLLSATINLFHDIHPLDLTDPDLWVDIGKYMILQSVVLLGAVIFKSHSLIKTALFIGCFFLVLSLFSLVVTTLVFFPNHLAQGAAMILTSLDGWHFAFWVVLAPICWYITYLRIAEYELT
jgi:hypothetical protein